VGRLTVNKMCLNDALPGELSIGDLTWRCRQESAQYLAGNAHNETYCLELFRRAIVDQDQAAWPALYTHYEPLVAEWARHHPKFQHNDCLEEMKELTRFLAAPQ